MFAELTIFSASIFSIPYCNQNTFVPTLTDFFAISGVSADGLKTLTISIGVFTSSSFSKTNSPFIFFPAENGFIGITL